MDYDAFVLLLRASLPEGLIMENPGGGSSKIMGCNDERTCYKRGHSRLYIKHCDMYQAFSQYCGRSVATTDLKGMAPAVFDTKHNGHDCHCTFFFMALRQMGFINKIRGTGRKGDPFVVQIPPQQVHV